MNSLINQRPICVDYYNTITSNSCKTVRQELRSFLSWKMLATEDKQVLFNAMRVCVQFEFSLMSRLLEKFNIHNQALDR